MRQLITICSAGLAGILALVVQENNALPALAAVPIGALLVLTILFALLTQRQIVSARFGIKYVLDNMQWLSSSADERTRGDQLTDDELKQKLGELEQFGKRVDDSFRAFDRVNKLEKVTFSLFMSAVGTVFGSTLFAVLHV